MTRPSLFYTSLLAMMLTSGVMPHSAPPAVEIKQSPEAAQRKIDAAKAKRQRKAAKRAAQMREEGK